MIADRDSEPVPLMGEPASGLVGRAAYLAPGDDERERLAQAGIAATMALPLLIDGEQVATLQAYHPTPRRCGLERRGVVHLFAERLVARMTRFGWQP
jgi:GAF domain-containing protein